MPCAHLHVQHVVYQDLHASVLQDANNEFKLATDPSLAKVTGKYFVSGRESRGASTAQDPKTRRKLWQIMTEQTGAVY